MKKARTALLAKLNLISCAEKGKSWDNMTLEKYIHVWRLTYEGYHSIKFET